MTWFETVLWIIIILGVICLFSIWYASTHFHKVYYRLSSDKISKPVKFVLLADLHDKEYGEGNAKLLKAIEEERPDAVLVAGDMLTAHEDRTAKVAGHLIARLAERYPVFYGIGNHEAKLGWGRKRFGQRYEAYMEDIATAGAKVLRNDFLEMEECQIRIYGLDMERIYYKRFKRTPMADGYVEEKLGTLNDKCFNILLAHNPMYFDKYAKWKPELVLSGHVHGGLVRLPFFGGVIAPNLQLFPQYDGGKFTEGSSTMLLSRGLGFHSVEFRMWNPGEVVVIEITPEKAK